MRREDLRLSILNTPEGICCQEGENCGADTDNILAWYKHLPPEDIGVHLVKDSVLRRDAASIDDPFDSDTVLGHPVEDYPGMERRTLDRGEQFVLSRAQQIPTQSNPAQVGIDQHGPIAVIPGQAQQAGLPRAIPLQAFAQGHDIAAGARRDGAEHVADRRETRFDAGSLGMNAAIHDTTDAGNQLRRSCYADDAGRGSDHIDHVAGLSSGADGIPMSIEGTDRERNPGP